jgi:hypothetical protein
MGEIMIKRVNYGEWGQCIEISNGLVDIVATLDFGPRIIRYGLTGKANMFFEDTNDELSASGEEFEVFGENSGWHIYGGHRLWHSPEAKPRSYYPDNNPVECEEFENGIILRPEPEKLNNLQKEISVIMEPNNTKVRVIHRTTNIGAWDIEFAQWALTVMAPGGKEILPQSKRETGLLGNRVLALWPYTNMNDERVYWGDKFITLKQDSNAKKAFKLGVNNEDGWAAYFNFGCMFVKHYNHLLEGVYPDFGVSYETYTNNVMLEMETLGELILVEPGETVEHEEKWELFDGVDVPSNDEDEIAEMVEKYI